MDLLQRHFLPADVEHIVKIQVSSRLGEDVIAWQPEKSGVFSVRSAYRLALDERLRHLQSQQAGHPKGDEPSELYYGGALLLQGCVFLRGVWLLIVYPHGLIKIAGSSRSLTYVPCVPPEDTFHTLCRCPHAVALWQSMAQH